MTSSGETGGARVRRALLAALAVCAVLSLTYLAWRDAPAVAAIEGQTLDWRFRLRGETPPGDEVLLVVIDDRAVAAAGRWPVPRAMLADAVRTLARAEAKVIAFDLLFADAEAGDGAGDRELAAALREAGTAVVPFAFVLSPKGVGGAPPGSVARSAFRTYSLPDRGRLASGLAPAGLVVPIAGIGEAAAGAGHVTVVLEPGGSLRHERTAIVYGEDLYPSLAIETVRLYLGLPRDAVAVRVGEEIALGDLRVGVDAEMRLAVNHYGPEQSFRTLSLSDVLAGSLPADTVRGRIVLIGATATGVGDSFVTPFSHALPGPEHFATVIDNVLHARPLIRGNAALAFDLAAILAGALLTALAASLGGPLTAFTAGLAVIAAWAATAFFAFAWARLWLDGVFPTLSILLTLGLVAAVRLGSEGRLRRDAERRRTNLSRYVPPALADALSGGAGAGQGQDTVQQAAVMFVDMVGFTRLGEHLSPAEQLALLRAFHARVEAAVAAEGGIIDKFVGDGASAVFGVSSPSPSDAARALRSARKLAADVAAWAAERQAAGNPAPAVGIGVHYGPVIVGDIGGATQRQFTVSGDTVNVASRLETLTRSLGAVILASDAVVDCARAAGAPDAFAGFVELEPQPIRGRSRPVGVWAWPGEDVRSEGAGTA